MKAKLPDTLYRNGTYYFRKRIPADLIGRPPFEEKQRVVQFSLGVKSPQAAAKAMAGAYAEYERQLAAARGSFGPSTSKSKDIVTRFNGGHIVRPSRQQLSAAVDRFHSNYLAENSNVQDARDNREFGALGVEMIAGRFRQEWEQIICELENAPLFPDRSIRIAGELLERERWELDPDDQDFDWLCDRIRYAELSACKAILSRSINKEYLTAAELRRQEIEVRTLEYTIGDAIADYIELNPLATEMHEKMRLAAEVWHQLMPVTKVSEIDPHHVIDFIDALRHLPKNAKQRFPGLSCDQAIDANKALAQPFATISATTIKDNYIGQINTAVAVALERKRVAHNPFYGRRVIGSSKAIQDRRPFTFDELRNIFCHPVFHGSRSAEHRYRPGKLLIKDHHYWPPIIALYTGMRASEIGALELSHVQWLQIGQEQLPYFKNIPGTKTDSAVRSLPVHPQLVEIGFLEYCERIAKSGSGRLFPDWHKPKNKKYSEARCIRNFNEIVVADATGSGPGFHCFRYTLLSELEENGFSYMLLQKMMGHKSVTGGYFKPEIERYYKRFCDALKYSELDLPALLARSPTTG